MVSGTGLAETGFAPTLTVNESKKSATAPPDNKRELSTLALVTRDPETL